jgi:hypothetical protein
MEVAGVAPAGGGLGGEAALDRGDQVARGVGCELAERAAASRDVARGDLPETLAAHG